MFYDFILFVWPCLDLRVLSCDVTGPAVPDPGVLNPGPDCASATAMTGELFSANT